jgi:outer membrane immunogenic protein
MFCGREDSVVRHFLKGAKMNKKGFLLATSAGFAFAPMAHAADMPLKAPPPPLPPAPMWTGFYIGGNVGTVWQQAQNTVNGGAPYAGGMGGSSQVNSEWLPFSSTPTTSRTGLIGGGQIGYNWQNGSYVWGIEADFQGLSGTGTSSSTQTIWPYGAVGSTGRSSPRSGVISVSNRIRWLSTIRTRQGLAFGNTMAYVTGGVAIGGVRNSATFQDIEDFGDTPYSAAVSQSKTRVGWTVGFGVEHMLDQHWTIAGEGLFVDLGNNNSTVFTNAPHPSGVNVRSFKTTPFSLKTTQQAVIGRLKLNYKF